MWKLIKVENDIVEETFNIENRHAGYLTWKYTRLNSLAEFTSAVKTVVKRGNEKYEYVPYKYEIKIISSKERVIIKKYLITHTDGRKEVKEIREYYKYFK